MDPKYSTEPSYKRLTPTRPRTFGIPFPAQSSLWLGGDHLLLVGSIGYSETYQRFNFGDIQAIWIRRTDGWKFWSLGWGILAGLFVLLAVASADLALAARLSALGLPALILVTFLLLNVAAGPSCVCHLRTAVQTVELPSLNRLSRATRVMSRLRPLIVEAQGELTRDQALAALQELAAGVSGGAPFATNPTPQPPQATNLSPTPSS